jgi:uncharacterized protein
MRREDRRIVEKDGLRAIIEAADVCRLGFALGNTPYIVTMNFGFEWEGEYPRLFFHCAKEGRKLDMMRANPRVCFELDHGHELVTGSSACSWGMKYSSIVGYGALHEVGDEGERLIALDHVMSHYGWSGRGDYAPAVMSATTLLVLVVDELSGKRRD